MNPYLHDLLDIATTVTQTPEAWDSIVDFDELRLEIECEIAELFGDPIDVRDADPDGGQFGPNASDCVARYTTKPKPFLVQ